MKMTTMSATPMMAAGVCEGRASLDVASDLTGDRPQGLGLALLGEDVETLHQRKAGVDHGGELAGEDRHLLVLDLAPELEGDPGRGLLRDLGDEDRATPQLTYRGRAVGRFDLPVLV